ncbi:Microcin C7 resistance protein [Rickettsia canadensis str. McKiel]|uniref:Microcin C7 resistance protein n=1 Tax=Rickettsia canadensis (strain McKiel) TaxID=293613 RepID=A8EYK0_RICCK|nr:Microcin C7 resistance protein [Rickettsia canadensis str. McKiel]
MVNISKVSGGNITGKIIGLIIKDFCLKHIQNIEAYTAEGIGHSEINHPIIMNHDVTISDSVLSFTSPFEIIENK